MIENILRIIIKIIFIQSDVLIVFKKKIFKTFLRKILKA